MLNRLMIKRAIMVGWDCTSWFLAATLIVSARFDLNLSVPQQRAVLVYVLSAATLQVIAGLLTKTYLGRFRVGTLEESLAIAVNTVVVGIVLGFLYLGLVGSDDLPRSLAFLAPPVALMIMAAGRWVYRTWRVRGNAIQDGAERVLIYGAGELGYQLVRMFQTQSPSPYRVVGFIDDDRAKRNLRLRGVPVRGTRDDLARITADRDVDTLILSIGNADARLILDVETMARLNGLTLKVVPHSSLFAERPVQLSDVREVDIADILGRRQIETDICAIADYLTGKRVLITGAGGSIGSELARQVHRFGPAELALLDRDESGLHGVQLSIYGNGLLDTPDMVLCDIRDRDALRKVFEAHRPEVVFHAAALKHLPMLEQYPDEGWKTNVLGTLNVLELSAEFHVRQFVNISTDKAADPTSILGWTKRQAERLTAWHALTTEGTYLSVRFGNVLGSRGSMLHTFRAQIEGGGPVTVTDPAVTRYFMTIPEACELVIQAGAIGRGGEVLVLDMGEPVSILDVAQRLIAQSGKDVDIVFTGLRPGEKMHEDLFSGSEAGVRPYHPLISHVGVPPLDPGALSAVREQQGQHRGTGDVSVPRVAA